MRYVVAHRRRPNGEFLTGVDGYQYQIAEDYGRTVVRYQAPGARLWHVGGEFQDRESALAFVRGVITQHSSGGPVLSTAQVGRIGSPRDKESGMGEVQVYEKGADAPYEESTTTITVISERKARASGTQVITGHSADEALRWYTVCREHNAPGSLGYARWATRTEAKQASRNPAGWCAGCQEGEAK